jgi:hypothetical protein
MVVVKTAIFSFPKRKPTMHPKVGWFRRKLKLLRNKKALL